MFRIGLFSRPDEWLSIYTIVIEILGLVGIAFFGLQLGLVKSTVISYQKNVNSSQKIDLEDRINLYSPSPYNLEDYCGTPEKNVKFYIDSWKAAIFQIGHDHSVQTSPRSRKIHKCKVLISTNETFGLVATIEQMKIRGQKDYSYKWQCSDYVQFISPSRNILGKFLSSLDVNILEKKSEELCGDKKLDREHMESIFDLSTDANSFSTATNDLIFLFHQDDDKKKYQNNSFRIVVTTFKHLQEPLSQKECEGQQKCYGVDLYCIHKGFICDGHVNCAFPGAGTDEKLCQTQKVVSYNMVSVVIITLTSMVSLGIAVCFVSSLMCRLRSRLNSRPRSSTPASASNLPLSASVPSAPSPEEATLPSYETVILGDSLAKLGLATPESDALPPKYEHIFPDGPPTASKEGGGGGGGS